MSKQVRHEKKINVSRRCCFIAKDKKRLAIKEQREAEEAVQMVVREREADFA